MLKSINVRNDGDDDAQSKAIVKQFENFAL